MLSVEKARADEINPLLILYIERTAFGNKKSVVAGLFVRAGSYNFN
jgi:hypothetical protein